MRVFLLRHGQTPSNVAGLLDTGPPGPALTRLGERQAAALPGAFAERPMDALVVSNLERTRLTAAPLAHSFGLDPVTLEGFREVEAGDLEMSSDREAHHAYLATVFAWARGDLERRVPGGPDGHTFLGRFDRSLAEIASRGWDDVAVVSHGAAIRSWASARVRGADLEMIERTPLANTGLVAIEGDPDSGWHLVDWSSRPLGGAHLTMPVPDDPTGDAVEA
ncbi:histidine phosphatase family protein [Nocardiopsis sp. HNM0947]|uniref:Histidine phosphatase family protein n=1 Tax=Nocardiopsis coralli TaxID=2772213 RepID=A0ABR9PF11_9ACTN|nr:histidine phosphatase family protein [Nocardiopsis coralli]MBE3002421.1 histidine phosphatase family protein [Nocardiopsis coralli]